MHRLISASFVIKYADGRALALPRVKPIVTHKPLRLLDDWHEVLVYPAVDLCTVLWIKVVVTNDSEHDASPWLDFRFRLTCEARSCTAGAVISRKSVAQKLHSTANVWG